MTARLLTFLAMLLWATAGLAAQLEAWLTGPRAQALIDGYKIAGEKLFHFNAKTGAGD